MGYIFNKPSKPTGYWFVGFNLDWDSADNWCGVCVKVKADDEQSAYEAAFPMLKTKFRLEFLDSVTMTIKPELE
jgi:hypothetical protein